MDERTLYKTLAEAPDDEGHCMVFADWLLERGDPMAEFLTLQLEHHKKKLDTLRAQRAQDLLIMNWKRWTGELSRVIHRRACVFERGFLRVAEARVVASVDVESITQAPQWATVRQLIVTGDDAQIARVLESPWLQNLKHLTCPAHALARVTSPSFRLETLRLMGHGLEAVKPNAAWSALSQLLLHEFVPVGALALTAKEVHCAARSFGEAVSTLLEWIKTRALPDVLFVHCHNSEFKLERQRMEIQLAGVDFREVRALRAFGDLELDVRWHVRTYRGPANRLEW